MGSLHILLAVDADQHPLTFCESVSSAVEKEKKKVGVASTSE